MILIRSYNAPMKASGRIMGKAGVALLGVLALAADAGAQEAARYQSAAKRLFELADAGRYAEIDALFDENMAKAFPVEKRKGLFESLREKHGALKSLGPARLVPPQYALGPRASSAACWTSSWSSTARTASPGCSSSRTRRRSPCRRSTSPSFGRRCAAPG